MSTFRDDFDPLAVVADWLDAGRLGKVSTLLDLYDERATMECDCEGIGLTGRHSLAAYWAPKLESKHAFAFTLEDMILTADVVQVDCESHDGKPVRIRFEFTPSGKIAHTSCRPRGSV